MIVPFMYFFRSLSNKLRTIFLTLIFALYFPSYAIFRRKEEPKIFGFKNLMERGIRKCLTSVIRQISSKMFGKIIIKPLKFSKDWSSPWVAEQIQILQRRVECFSRALKVLSIALKVFSMYIFRKKTSLDGEVFIYNYLELLMNYLPVKGKSYF